MNREFPRRPGLAGGASNWAKSRTAPALGARNCSGLRAKCRWPGRGRGAIPAAMNDVLTALVVVALIATLVVLLAGVVTMTKGSAFNRKWGNKLMRARIAMQALAVMRRFALFLLNRDWGD